MLPSMNSDYDTKKENKCENVDQKLTLRTQWALLLILCYFITSI